MVTGAGVPMTHVCSMPSFFLTPPTAELRGSQSSERFKRTAPGPVRTGQDTPRGRAVVPQSLVALVALVRLLARARITHLGAEVLFHTSRKPRTDGQIPHSRDPVRFGATRQPDVRSTICLPGITPGVPHH